MLDKFWRQFPRVILNVNEEQHRFGMEALIMDHISFRIVVSHLPEDVVKSSFIARAFRRPAPLGLMEHALKVVPTRYNDPAPYVSRSPTRGGWDRDEREALM